MISLDTETTGIDLRHGAMPFLVTTSDAEGNQRWWEWDVDPLTRRPIIPDDDKQEIKELVETADELVLQNPKFDAAALKTIIPDLKWPWDRTKDTLLAGHLLASNQPHDLTTMALVYLGVNIKPYEDAIVKACTEARRIARSKYPEIRIAKEGLPEMPSAKEAVGMYDMWLPRVIAKLEGYPLDHPWYTVCSEYANIDSAVTLPLHTRMLEIIKKRKLEKIYAERLKILPVVFNMEERGITLSAERLQKMVDEYGEESEKCNRICVNIAKGYGYELSLPKSGNNKSLTEFVFDVLKLPALEKSKKTGAPSLKKTVIEQYESILPERSKQLTFVRKLKAKRQRDTAVSYMESYKRFWKPLTEEDWYILHPSLNSTGTNTLRFSSSNPNEQNISKKEGFNIRYAFGPAPGREWWSCDAKNIELRLPAYEAGEQAMIDLFERPNDAPYFGSNHLLAAHILHPKEFEACVNEKGEIDGRIFKKKYASTLYQWTKNGNFAVQYGAVETSGTADRAYHVVGGQSLIAKRLGKISDLNQKVKDFANRYGYVETMPDKTVDPDRGYPLLCTITDRGKILETVPLSYHVQGTAMWWMMKAMTRCQTKLEEWNAKGFDGHMIMQVHDELVFDFPKKADPVTNPKASNLGRIRILQRIMEMGGDDIGVPTPVSCEYHPDNWSEGVSL